MDHHQIQHHAPSLNGLKYAAYFSTESSVVFPGSDAVSLSSSTNSESTLFSEDTRSHDTDITCGDESDSGNTQIDENYIIQSRNSKLVRFCNQVQVFIIPPRIGNSVNQLSDKKVNFYPIVTNIIIPGRKHISNFSDLWYKAHEIERFDKEAYFEVNNELEPSGRKNGNSSYEEPNPSIIVTAGFMNTCDEEHIPSK